MCRHIDFRKSESLVTLFYPNQSNIKTDLNSITKYSYSNRVIIQGGHIWFTVGKASQPHQITDLQQSLLLELQMLISLFFYLRAKTLTISSKTAAGIVFGLIFAII